MFKRYFSILLSLIILVVASSASAEKAKPDTKYDGPDLNGVMQAHTDIRHAIILMMADGDIFDVTFTGNSDKYECVAVQLEPEEHVYDVKRKGKACQSHVINTTGHPIMVIMAIESTKGKLKGSFTYTLANADI